MNWRRKVLPTCHYHFDETRPKFTKHELVSDTRGERSLVRRVSEYLYRDLTVHVLLD